MFAQAVSATTEWWIDIAQTLGFPATILAVIVYYGIKVGRWLGNWLFDPENGTVTVWFRRNLELVDTVEDAVGHQSQMIEKQTDVIVRQGESIKKQTEAIEKVLDGQNDVIVDMKELVKELGNTCVKDKQ